MTYAEQLQLPQSPWVARRGLAWVIIAGMAIVEYLLFAHIACREVTWFVPTAYDQCAYLSHTYDVYQKCQSEGLLPGLWYGLSLPIPNGALFHVMAALLCLVIGP